MSDDRIEYPTSVLRFRNGWLQQRWAIESYEYSRPDGPSRCIGVTFEWRDVPEVKEE